VVEHGVRGVARARWDVTIAGRRDIIKRSGRRPAVLRPARQPSRSPRARFSTRVVEIKRTSAAAVMSPADAIEQVLSALRCWAPPPDILPAFADPCPER
jgi:hypothetical protein